MDFTLVSESSPSAFLEIAALVLVGALFGSGLALCLAWYRARAIWRFIGNRVWPLVAAAWTGRRVRAVPAAHSTLRLVPGRRVRVSGVVESDAPARAFLSGVPSVVCWYALGEVFGGTIDDGVIARTFTLRLQDGTSVRVAADHAAAGGRLTLADGGRHHWTDRRRARAWYCESRVSPGDSIDVSGYLQREIDPTGPRLRDRDAPMGWTVVAGDGPLVLAFNTHQPRALRSAS